MVVLSGSGEAVKWNIIEVAMKREAETRSMKNAPGNNDNFMTSDDDTEEGCIA